MPLRNLAWLLIVPAIVCLGLAISFSAPGPDKDYKLVRQIVDVLAEVDANYVRELNDEDKQKLVEDMINGGLHELDPHSEYLNEAKLKRFRTDSEGSFGGVGITLGIDPKTKLLKVDHPMPGTPAYDAGLIADDLIVKIAGEPVTPVSDTFTDQDAIAEARKRITGEVKSKVNLTIRREGRTPPEFDVQLERAKIDMHPVAGLVRRKDDPVKWEWFADPQQKIALVRIQTFSDLTAKELRAALVEIKAAGGRGLVLDLRDDPGGLLNQAIEVADTFLPEGRIVATRDRRQNEKAYSAKKKEFDVSTDKGREDERKNPTFIPIPGEPRPMAVLVNRHSASASEIVAAALQDHGRAVVVGERTYGKGSVQKLLPLKPDETTAVKLTTETYWRPSGKNMHRFPNSKETDDWGVRPDAGLEVPTTEDERIRYVLEMRKLEFVPGKPGAVGPNPPPPPTPKGADGKPLIDDSKPFDDRVLTRAIETLKRKLSGVGQAAPPALPGGALPAIRTAA